MAASSKVNFTKLTTKEQKQRYINQINEIKKLKTTLYAYLRQDQEVEDSTLEKAMDNLYKFDYELNDQNNLIENLSKAIIEEKLKPNTLGFNQICTILRGLLDFSYPNSRYSIELSGETISISSVEYESYKHLFWTNEALAKILGKDDMANK